VSVIFTIATTVVQSHQQHHRDGRTSWLDDTSITVGIGDKIREGDTYLVEKVLPPELAEVVFENFDSLSEAQALPGHSLVVLFVLWCVAAGTAITLYA
jgi:hypothetical protein